MTVCLAKQPLCPGLELNKDDYYGVRTDSVFGLPGEMIGLDRGKQKSRLLIMPRFSTVSKSHRPPTKALRHRAHTFIIKARFKSIKSIGIPGTLQEGAKLCLE